MASLGTLSLTFGQLKATPGAADSQSKGPRQPGGKLSNQLGVYRTIEGVRFVGGKVETGTLLVETVDGTKLDTPIPLLIRGGVVVDNQLQEQVLRLPAGQHFVFKGFETAEMIGVPPAVRTAALEQGWKEVPVSAAGFQCRPYFVALVVVEPKDFKLRKE